MLLDGIDTRMDDGDSSQTTETAPRTVNTLYGWRRMLSDDEDSSTDGGDLSTFMDGGGCSQTMETPPRTVDTIHG